MKSMERPDTKRWGSDEVARLIAIFESDRRFYDEVLTLLPVPLATLGADGVLFSANNAFLREFGIGRGQLEGKRLDSVVSGVDCAALLNPHTTAVLPVGRYEVHVTPIPRWERGETEWMAVFLAQSEPTPPPPPVIAPATPDAELAATAAAVEAAQRLAARVTHETNNLIMIASGYGREILAQLPADSPLRDDLNTLLSATERIEAMAGQLNEFSRTGRSEKAPHALRDLLPASGYQLPAAVPDFTAHIDRTALAGVFSALPMAAAGPLAIEIEVTDQEAVLTVKGFGMSAESLRQQFEILNKAAREGKPGARECTMAGPKLAQAGVRWRVTEPAALEMRLPKATAAPVVSAARTALVVDDQPEIRTIMRRILEGKGFVVSEAGTGEEAISLLDRRRTAFDVLVTDMRMPGMTGRDLADRVRFRHPETPILFVSGFTDDPGVQSGLLPERAMFLSKPFHPEQLIGAVTKLLEGK